MLNSMTSTQTKLLKHLLGDVEPYVEVLNSVVTLRNVKEGLRLSLLGLESKTYYTVVVSCASPLLHSSLTIATSESHLSTNTLN